MARQPLVKVTCDRCKKTFEIAPDAPSNDWILVDAKAFGLGEIMFEDLCRRCRGRVRDLVALIAKVSTGDEDAANKPDGTIQSTPSRDDAGQHHPPANGGEEMRDEEKLTAGPEYDDKDHDEREEEDEEEEEDEKEKRDE